jgi:prevent-host-death family protein
MKSASMAEVKARLSDYLELARSEGPVLITRNGKAVAMLVAISNEDEITQLVRSHPLHEQTLANGTQRYKGETPLFEMGEPKVQVPPEHAAPWQELTQQIVAPPPNLNEMSIAEREQWVLAEMLRQGLLSEAKLIDHSSASKWEPILIKGKPLSQTIIEDRR